MYHRVSSKKVDLSSTLFVDVHGRQKELGGMIDTRGPEFSSGCNPYGPARTLRFLGLLFAAFVVLVFVTFCLIVEFGGPLPGGGFIPGY